MIRYWHATRPLVWLIIAAIATIAFPAAGWAQVGGGGGGFGGGGLGGLGGGGGGGFGGGGGGSTVGGSELAGVFVDATGVLQRRVFADPTGQLTKKRLLQARMALEQQIAQPSPLRKVSLTRLEAALREQLAAGAPPSDAIRHLAGLTRLKYVFFYPDSGDVVIAGPAEGWGADLSGRVVGLFSGQPVLQLEDLAVALRAFPPTGASTPAIYCSIDPTQEGLARMQQFLSRIGRQATPAHTPQIVQGLRQSLGLQTISIGGISPQTHFAQVLVEADYRMKLIGIGLERPPVKIPSYVQMVNPAAVSRNALQRWYFVPNYECVRVSDDALAMELVGQGVKLVGEDELVGKGGTRVAVKRSNVASEKFVRAFTQRYPELAKRSPVYAQLRNVIDMSIAAAFIQEQDYYGRAEWNMEVLGNEQSLPVETYRAPEQVATAVNSIWKGNRLMTPVGGGVQIQPQRALDSPNLLADEEGQLQAVHSQVDLSDLPENRWWWD